MKIIIVLFCIFTFAMTSAVAAPSLGDKIAKECAQSFVISGPHIMKLNQNELKAWQKGKVTGTVSIQAPSGSTLKSKFKQIKDSNLGHCTVVLGNSVNCNNFEVKLHPEDGEELQITSQTLSCP